MIIANKTNEPSASTIGHNILQTKKLDIYQQTI